MRLKTDAIVLDEGVDTQPNLTRLHTIWQHILQHLQAQKARRVEMISEYPHPIPACDDQFNGLLEDRAIILQELSQVQSILAQRPTASAQMAILNEFMLSSRYIDNQLASEIRQLLTGLDASPC